MSKYWDTYAKVRERLLAFRYVGFLAGWDGQTEAPEGATELEAARQATLSEMQYELTLSPDYVEAVDYLYHHQDELNEVDAHEIHNVYEEQERNRRTPKEEYTEHSRICAEAYPAYVKAKRNNDFEVFRPYLEKILDYTRKQTVWQETPERKGYDVLLDLFEKNSSREMYDRFFGVLREKLVPFVKDVAARKLDFDRTFTTLSYDEAKQKEFCSYLQDALCFDKSRGVLKESEHPFTDGHGTDDVRITVHYYPELFISSIFSVIHETGHGLYEQQCDKALNNTFSGGGASMGLHESQSRLYENMIGRSPAFWEAHYGKLKEFFPEQLGKVPFDDFMKYINTAELSFIRTEADELTYPLHIMLRYQIEQEYIGGKLEVKDFPKRWNELFEEYFGMVPPTDTEGVLQDVHWAYGEMGYFPTYALGSAYAAQFYAAMGRDIDIDKVLRSGTTKEINEWLRTHVHCYGSSKDPEEILKLATGEAFDPNYYVNYLIDKYSKVYGL